MLLTLTVLFFIVGSLWRRVWGGWRPFQSKALSKGQKFAIHYPLCFAMGALPFVAAGYSLAVAGLAGLAFALTVGAVLAHPQGHGRAQDMGWGNPNGTLPTGVCVAIFLGNYGTAMMVMGAAVNAITMSQAGTVYMLFGLLSFMPHLLAQVANDIFRFKFKPAEQGWAFDGTTAIGEFGLMAVMVAPLPLSLWLCR